MATVMSGVLVGSRDVVARTLRGREIVAWAIVATGLCALGATAVPRVFNDGFQYLSVADNIERGNGIATDLVHFDVERAHGVVPAPLTTFGSGYPIVVAGLARAGLSPRVAAVGVAVVAVGLTLLVLAFACGPLGLSPWMTRFVLFAFALNANTLWLGGTVLSETLFTLLVTSAIGLLLWADLVPPRTSLVLAFVASLSLGCAYWVRYAGLLVIASVAVALTVAFVVRRTRAAFATLVAGVLPGAALMTVGLWRNHVIAGSWKGGNTKVVHRPLGFMLKESAHSAHHLLFGTGASGLARVAQLAVLAAVIVAIVGSSRVARRGPHRQGVVLIAIVVAVYSVLMFRVGQTSVITYDQRMFFPILPLILLLLGTLSAPLMTSRRAWAPIGLAAVAYLTCGLTTFLAEATRPVDSVVQERWSLPTGAGTPLRGWLEAHLGPREPLLSLDGQATGGTLGRPVVSLVSSRFSDARWDEDELAWTMSRFHARYLAIPVHPLSDDGKLVLGQSPILAALAQGHGSGGFVPAARNAEVSIYERPSGSSSATVARARHSPAREDDR